MRSFIELVSSQKQFSLLSDGDSMLPILQSGDIIHYRKIPYESIHENDLILVRKQGILFTHRVIYKTPRYLVARGDNNTVSDGKIRPGEIIAKATHIKRKGKIVKLDEFYILQSRLYFDEIERVLSALRKNGIDAVILKGLPLHLYYEGSRPNRLYADCDILIRNSDAAQTLATMKLLGYRKLDSSLSQRFSELKDKRTEETYAKAFGRFPVVFDVHYEAVFLMNQLGKLDRLYPQSLVDHMTDCFLREKQTVTVRGTPFPILAKHHLPIYLALHFFRHNYTGTYRLSLIRAVLKKTGSDGTYQKMAGFINAYHLNGYIYPSFLFLMKYYPSRIPRAFLESIRPPIPQRRFIEKNILPATPFDDSGRIQSGITRFRKLFFLSPGPLWRKSLVFFTPAVFYSLWWVFQKRLLYILHKKRL